MAFSTSVLLVLIALGVSEISCRVNLQPGARVSHGAELKGDITIGSGTVVHPQARIIAEAGPITIGYGNIIEDGVTIINRVSNNGQIIGNGNTFKANSVIEASRIGDANIVNEGAYVGSEVVLSNGVIIAPGCSLTIEAIIPQGSRISGEQCQ